MSGVVDRWPGVYPCSGAASDPLRLPCIAHTKQAPCPGCGLMTCYRHTHAHWRGECFKATHVKVFDDGTDHGRRGRAR